MGVGGGGGVGKSLREDLSYSQWSLVATCNSQLSLHTSLQSKVQAFVVTRTQLFVTAWLQVTVITLYKVVCRFSCKTKIQIQFSCHHQGLFCPSTFSMGCALINHYEVAGVGANWDNIWEQPLDGEVTSTALILILLAADGALYFLLGWYIKTLFPGRPYNVLQNPLYLA